MTTWLFVANLVLATVPAWIASRKGHPFAPWYILGVLLSPVISLPMALLVKHDTTRHRRCPHCTEWVSTQATVCPACRSALEPVVQTPAEKQAGTEWVRVVTGGVLACTVVLIVVLVIGYRMTG